MSQAQPGVDNQQALDKQTAPVSQKDKEQKAALKGYSQQLKTDSSGQPSMHVKIYSPFHEYFDGPAQSLSAENATGPFDVLPRHHNFISLLSPCDVVVRRAEQDDSRFRISGGLMHVKADEVVVFLDV